MINKYIKLSQFEELMKTIHKRDCFMDWTDEYEKFDKSAKNSIKFIRDNAMTLEQIKEKVEK